MAFGQSLYKVELLDSSLVPITRVQDLVALDTNGNIIEYGVKLSDHGQAKIRIGTKDSLWTKFGNITQPYVNHVRIYRAQAVVYQGIVINVPKRNKQYIEVEAYDYLFLLTKVLIRHDTSGDTNLRTFKSGTMATVIQTLLTEAKADAGTLLNNVQIGTIENPTFPTGYVDAKNAALTGQWTFSDNFFLQYDYRDIYYVLRSLAAYGNCDFELVNDSTTNKLTFNFRKYIGNKQPDMVFRYSSNYGVNNVEDYNAPLFGERMVNTLLGIAADNNSSIFTVEKEDSVSVKATGRLKGVAAYVDVKDKNLLATRLVEELRQVSTPDAELQLILNERAYPLGQYGLGDVVTAWVTDHVISVNQQRRVVAITNKVRGNGRDIIKLVTNLPRADQV